MFRIAQEALQNALRHADAERIEVRLERRRRAAVLSVADDGGGFDAVGGGAARARGSA